MWVVCKFVCMYEYARIFSIQTLPLCFYRMPSQRGICSSIREHHSDGYSSIDIHQQLILCTPATVLQKSNCELPRKKRLLFFLNTNISVIVIVRVLLIICAYLSSPVSRLSSVVSRRSSVVSRRSSLAAFSSNCVVYCLPRWASPTRWVHRFLAARSV